MSVNIIWSLTEGGDPISSTIDHGDYANGEETDSTKLWIRHDGGAAITNVGVYIRTYTGTYAGSFTPAGDITEILSWGSGEDDYFGGFQYSWDNSDWPTDSLGNVCQVGKGDSETNAITLPAEVTGAAEGTIDPSTSASFYVRVAVPTTVDTIGARQWDQVLRYSYTS